MLTIYGVPLSVHTRKVIVAANVKSIEYKLEPVIPFQPPANWDKLSPTGLIPVIDHDGFRLPDSTAICLYLDRISPDPPLLPAVDHNFARAMFLDAYAGGMLFRNMVHGLFFQRVIRPGILNEQPDQVEIETILATRRPRIFDYLESQVDDGQLGGADLSIADLAIASNLVNYCYLGFAIDSSAHPMLSSFFERTVSMPAFRTALAAEEVFADQMRLDRSFCA